MTSCSEPRVLRGPDPTESTPLATPDLRTGQWTRLGGPALVGDRVTESALTSVADRARSAGHAEGYAVGWALGVRRAEAAAATERRVEEELAGSRRARQEQEHAQALAVLRSAAERFERLTHETAAHLEEQAARLAVLVATELVGSAATAVTAEHLVAQVGPLLPPATDVVVRVHPDMAGRDVVWPVRVTVVADPLLGPADAVVDLGDGVVDLRVDRALSRLGEVL